MAKKIISFASDFGLQDGSVGVVKGVISRIDNSLSDRGVNGVATRFDSLSLSHTYIHTHTLSLSRTHTHTRTTNSVWPYHGGWVVVDTSA